MMKTAISIPDRVFAAADRLAKHLGVSRSELYSKAIQAYLADRDPAHLTEQMNYACGDSSTKLGPGVRTAQKRAVGGESW